MDRASALLAYRSTLFKSRRKMLLRNELKVSPTGLEPVTFGSGGSRGVVLTTIPVTT